jgi:archaemetzincin
MKIKIKLKDLAAKSVLALGIILAFSFKTTFISAEKITIQLQPFTDLPSKYTFHVYKELKKIYPDVIVLKAIDLPKSAYYAPRHRYRADSIINYLRKRTTGGKVTIGLTSKDISTTKDKIKDYGIMGLGYQPGRSCVVSCFRLSKKKSLEQFFKVSIHELGHTQGLPHCPSPTCFMRDAKGENHNDEEKEFCPKCKAHLEARGWSFD